MPEKRMHTSINDVGAGTLNRVPLELQIKILFLLPVKTLLVLRSVCKWFLSMIDDPSFVWLHLGRNKTKVLAMNDRNWTNSIHSSVDGLVLLRSRWSPEILKTAMLYNPSMGKKRILERKFYQFALGYSSVSSSSSSSSLNASSINPCMGSKRHYRVLGLSSDQAWVYSIEFNTWSEVTLGSGFRPNTQANIFYSPTHCLGGGAVVWSECTVLRNTPKPFRLALFNFHTKRFGYTDKMMAVRFGIFTSNTLSVGVWKIEGEDKGGVASVFALQTDTMMLVPLYTIPQLLLPYRSCEVCISVLSASVCNGKWVTLYWSRGNGVAKRYALNYDLKTHAISRRRRQETWENYVSGDVWMGFYVESLIWFRCQELDWGPDAASNRKLTAFLRERKL